MIQKEHLDGLRASFQRIFSMKVTRSTFREVQNAIIMAAQGDREGANQLFEGIATGVAPKGIDKNGSKQVFEKIVDEYSIPLRLAREVTERAEFVSVITSDALAQGQGDNFAFLNRLRRIDGEEYTFVTDLPGTISMVQHFISRMRDLTQNDKGKAAVGEMKQQLKAVKESLEALMTK